MDDEIELEKVGHYIGCVCSLAMGTNISNYLYFLVFKKITITFKDRWTWLPTNDPE